MENLHKSGDICPQCQQMGMIKQLRHFYINLNEQIIKCESDKCLFPYEDDMSSDDDDDAEIYIASILQQIDGTTDGSSIDTSKMNEESPSEEISNLKLSTDQPNNVEDSNTPAELFSNQLPDLCATESTIEPTPQQHSTPLNMPSLLSFDLPIPLSVDADICEANPSVNISIPLEYLNSTAAKETKSPVSDKVESALSKVEPPSNKVVSGTSTQDEIPKLRISRYFDAINAQLAKDNYTTKPKKIGRSRRRRNISMRKIDTESECNVDSTSGVTNSLNELVELLQNKNNLPNC